MSSLFAQQFNSASKLNWWKDPPVELEKRVEILQRFEDYLDDDSEHGEALRELVNSLRAEAKDIAAEAKRENPLAFATLSYEQILKCNSWVWGITYVCDFDANRKGKTAGGIISALLWIFPNDPAWVIFDPYTDEWNRECRLLRRPSMSNVIKIQRYLAEHPELKGNPRIQPYEGENLKHYKALQEALPHCFEPAFPYPSYRDPKVTAWQGAPDADYHKQIIMPEWNK
jgi:hypothetical protein